MNRSGVDEVVREILRKRITFSTGDLAEALGISRQTAQGHLRRLVAAGELVPSGRGGGVTYHAPRKDPAGFRFQREGLTEEAVLREVVQKVPAFGVLPAHPSDLLAFAITELAGNAIRHSGSGWIEVRVGPAGGRLALEVLDEGRGLFAGVRSRLGLPASLDAALRLSAGVVPSPGGERPARGLLLVSHIGARFEAESEGLLWTGGGGGGSAVHEVPASPGTRFRVEIDPSADVSLRSLFELHAPGEDYWLPPRTVRVNDPSKTLVRRAEAKRLLAGLARHRGLLLDFEGLNNIGRDFADEILRVWPSAHPGVRLEVVNMETWVRRRAAEVGWRVEMPVVARSQAVPVLGIESGHQT